MKRKTLPPPFDERFRDLRVEIRLIDEIKPQPRNARTHSKGQIRQIADSIDAFGFTNPILVDESGFIIAGHGRVEAARLLGMTCVPTLRLDHLSEADKHAYVIADNRLAERAGWDQDLLALELEYIHVLDVDFDLTLTGWSTPELDSLLKGSGSAEDEDPDDDLAPYLHQDAPSVTQRGDYWKLGNHRLLCGDARDASAFERLLAGERAQMVLTDPPYNVRIDGHVSGLGAVQHREFAMASGEMSEAEYTSFLRTVLRNLAEFSTDGSLHFVFQDWRHMGELMNAASGVYHEFKNLLIWNKTNGGMGSLYRSKHELLFLYKHGTAAHVNNIELGQHGRYRTNVWDYPGANTFRRGRKEELSIHPTCKPIALLKDAILDCSERGAIVLDSFGGSGSIFLAAEKTARRAYVMEIDPLYVDASIRRWQKRFGGTAIHDTNGHTFTTLEGDRDKRDARTRSSGNQTILPPVLD